MNKHLIKISLLAALTFLALSSCEYGTEHGRAATNSTTTNPSTNDQTSTEKPHSSEELEDVDDGNKTKNVESPDAPNPNNFRNEDLRFEGKKVILTRHGRCRMDCRHIDAYEIQEVIDQGHINSRKSKAAAKPGQCPTTAYEGTTRDGQFIRVIVGTCETPKIITVIDLKNDYNCTCK